MKTQAVWAIGAAGARGRKIRDAPSISFSHGKWRCAIIGHRKEYYLWITKMKSAIFRTALVLLMLSIFSTGVLSFIACGGGGGGGGGDDDSSNVSSSDDDAVDDDTSDDDAGDDDTLDDDDSANDDDTGDDDDDDTADDDDTTYYAPCPRGYTIPDGASKGGCVTQIDGGAAGLYGIAIDVDSQNMPNILGAKGREIVVYTPPPDEPTPLEYPKSYTKTGWVEDVIDYMGDQPKLVVDQNDVRHVVWQNLWTHDLMYADDSGGAWNIEVVDDGADGPPSLSKVNVFDRDNGGAMPGLVVDDDGFAHIVYRNESTLQLLYTTNRSGSWETEVAWDMEYDEFREYDAGVCDDIALSPDGDVWITTSSILSNGFFFKTYLLTNESGAWETEWERTNTYCAEIKIDADGQVHVGDIGGGGIEYWSKKPKENWTGTVVDEDGSNWPALDLDSEGYPHLIYEKNFGLPKTFRYASGASGGWSLDDAFLLSDYFPLAYDVAIDGNDNVHIGTVTSGPPIHVESSESGWDIEAWDEPQGVGNVSLALDPEDRAHIVYHHYYEGIREAVVENGIPSIIQIAAGSNLILSENALRYDPTGIAHLLYIEDGDDAVIHFGSRQNGEWNFETVPLEFEEYVGRIGFFDFSPEGNPYLLLVVDGNGKLAFKENGLWSVETVGPNWTSIRDIDIDEESTIRILYGTFNLSYAERTAGGDWVFKVIDDDFSPTHASLAVDSSGNVYIGYVKDLNDLRFATNRSGEWVNYAVPGNGGRAGALSMFLDDQERPCIYFAENPNWSLRKLRYARLEADDTWKFADVEISDGITPPSAAIDSQGHHHIAYNFQAGAVHLEAQAPIP
ncbi:MAG: hypothetical protein H6684_12185 [Deltaproteobacteria bacterium]|nr:hypothetical protein [Deltaproteobacteria bacterium]MCB9489484.1 hypothetical protein [Deltaproteobacteria bacterium]